MKNCKFQKQINNLNFRVFILCLSRGFQCSYRQPPPLLIITATELETRNRFVLCMLMAKVIEALKCGIKFDAETTEKCYKPLRLTLSSIFYLATDGTTGNLSEGETDDSNKKQICGNMAMFNSMLNSWKTCFHSRAMISNCSASYTSKKILDITNKLKITCKGFNFNWCKVKIQKVTKYICYKPYGLTVSSVLYLISNGLAGNLPAGENDISFKKRVCANVTVFDLWKKCMYAELDKLKCPASNANTLRIELSKMAIKLKRACEGAVDTEKCKKKFMTTNKRKCEPKGLIPSSGLDLITNGLEENIPAGENFTSMIKRFCGNMGVFDLWKKCMDAEVDMLKCSVIAANKLKSEISNMALRLKIACKGAMAILKCRDQFNKVTEKKCYKPYGLTHSLVHHLITKDPKVNIPAGENGTSSLIGICENKTVLDLWKICLETELNHLKCSAGSVKYQKKKISDMVSKIRLVCVKVRAGYNQTCFTVINTSTVSKIFQQDKFQMISILVFLHVVLIKQILCNN